MSKTCFYLVYIFCPSVTESREYICSTISSYVGFFSTQPYSRFIYFCIWLSGKEINCQVAGHSMRARVQSMHIYMNNEGKERVVTPKS